MAEDIASLGIRVDSTQTLNAATDLDRLRSAGSNAERQMSSTERASRSLGVGLSALGNIIATLGIAALAKQLVQTVEQVQNIDIRIKGLTKSTNDYANAQKFLSELSQRHHKDNLILSNSFSKLLALEQAGIVTRKQAMSILEGFSNAQTKTGASAEQLSQATYGLSQALSSGVVHMEELNQVSEPMPGLLNNIASTAGYTTGEFRKLVAEGRITSDIFGRILTESLKNYQGAAEAAGNTLTAQYSDVRNAWIELARAVETPVADVITPILNGIRSVIQGLAQDIREVNQLFNALFRNGQSAGAPDNGMTIDLTGRAKPDEFVKQQNTFRAEIEKTAVVTTKAAQTHRAAAQTHRAASHVVAQGLSDEQRAAKALQEEFIRTGEQLSRELALQGDNTRHATIEYEVMNGELKKLSETQKLYLLQKAAEIDNADIDEKNKQDQTARLKQLTDQYNQLTLSAREYYKLSISNLSPELQTPLLAGFDKIGNAEKINEEKAVLESYLASLNKVNIGLSDFGSISSAVFDSALGGINTVVGAFENLLTALAENTQAMEDLNQANRINENIDLGIKGTEQYNKLLKEQAANTLKFDKQRTQLEKQNTLLQLDGIRRISGASEQMFEENTTARKALHIVTMTLGAIEIAMELEGLIAKAASAILNQGEGDPYSAFARMAIMTGITAGILTWAGTSSAPSGGGSSGGGGASIELAGADTGTVLGDSSASSESVNNIIDLLSSIHAEEYVELRGINKGVSQLVHGIESTVTNLFKSGQLLDSITAKDTGRSNSRLSSNSGGDPIMSLIGSLSGGSKSSTSVISGGLGLAPINFGDILKGMLIGVAQYVTTQTTKSGGGGFFGIGGGEKTTTKIELQTVGSEIQRGLTDIFFGIAKTILQVGDQLGISVIDKLKDITTKMTAIDIHGLTGKEANDKITGVISAMLDDVATQLFDGIIGQYQKLGEGMLETAIRIVAEMTLVKDVLEKTSTHLEGNVIAVADALVQAAGGLEEFQKQFDIFYDKFFTEQEKQADLATNLHGILSTAFTQEQITTLSQSRQAYRDLISQVTNPEQYSLLLQLAEGADAYYTELERVAEATRKAAEAAAALQKQQLASYNSNFLTAAEKQFKLGTELYNELITLFSNDQIATLAGTRQAYKDLINEVTNPEQYALLLKLADGAHQYYTELERLAAVQAEAARAAQAAIDAYIKAQEQAHQGAVDAARQGVTGSMAVLQKAVDAQRVVLTEKYNAAVEKTKARIDAVSKSVQNLTSIVGALRNALESLNMPGQELLNRQKAQADLRQALITSGSKGGYQDVTGLNRILSGLSQPTENLFGSFEEYQRDFYLTAIDIETLLKGSEAQLSTAEKQLAVLEETLEQMQLEFEAEMKGLDDTLALAQAQIDAINGTTVAVMTIPGAIAALGASIGKLGDALAAQAANTAANSGFGTTTPAGPTATNPGPAVNTIINPPTTVDAVYRQILGRAPDASGAAYWQNQLDSGAVSSSNLANTIAKAAANFNPAGYSGSVSQSELQKSINNAQIYLAAQKSIKGFARGGLHEGGWRIVGEEGPELENTGQSRIYNQQQTRELINTDELVAEIKLMRDVAEKQQRVLDKIAQNTKTTADTLESAGGGNGPILVEIA